MRVLLIGAMAIITLCILIGVLVYDRKLRNHKYKILTALWSILLHDEKIKDEFHQYGNSALVGLEVKKFNILQECAMDPRTFGISLSKLVKSNIIINNPETIEFTKYGASYYDFLILPKMLQK